MAAWRRMERGTGRHSPDRAARGCRGDRVVGRRGRQRWNLQGHGEEEGGREHGARAASDRSLHGMTLVGEKSDAPSGPDRRVIGGDRRVRSISVNKTSPLVTMAGQWSDVVIARCPATGVDHPRQHAMRRARLSGELAWGLGPSRGPAPACGRDRGMAVEDPRPTTRRRHLLVHRGPSCGSSTASTSSRGVMPRHDTESSPTRQVVPDPTRVVEGRRR